MANTYDCDTDMLMHTFQSIGRNYVFGLKYLNGSVQNDEVTIENYVCEGRICQFTQKVPELEEFKCVPLTDIPSMIREHVLECLKSLLCYKLKRIVFKDFEDFANYGNCYMVGRDGFYDFNFRFYLSAVNSTPWWEGAQR